LKKSGSGLNDGAAGACARAVMMVAMAAIARVINRKVMDAPVCERRISESLDF
jgi:hypothetical protein